MATSWYGYHYYDRVGKRCFGITTDPQRRQSELDQRWPGGSLYIAIGPVTEAEARLGSIAGPRRSLPSGDRGAIKSTAFAYDVILRCSIECDDAARAALRIAGNKDWCD